MFLSSSSSSASSSCYLKLKAKNKHDGLSFFFRRSNAKTKAHKETFSEQSSRRLSSASSKQRNYPSLNEFVSDDFNTVSNNTKSKDTNTNHHHQQHHPNNNNNNMQIIMESPVLSAAPPPSPNIPPLSTDTIVSLTPTTTTATHAFMHLDHWKTPQSSSSSSSSFNSNNKTVGIKRQQPSNAIKTTHLRISKSYTCLKDVTQSMVCNPFDLRLYATLQSSTRYSVQTSIISTLFGEMLLAWDNVTQQFVVIKCSNKYLMHAGISWNDTRVRENVLKEEKILQYLQRCIQKTPLPHDGMPSSVSVTPFTSLPALRITSPTMQRTSSSDSCSSSNALDMNRCLSSPTSEIISAYVDMTRELVSPSPHLQQQQQQQQGSEIEGEDEEEEIMKVDTLTTTTKEEEHENTNINTHTSSSSSSSHQQPISSDIVPARLATYVDSFSDNVYHYLVTEYASKGDMYNVLVEWKNKRMSETVVRPIFKSLVQLVLYLHQQKIAHLDLSLENVVLDKHNRIHLIDFALAVLHPSSTETDPLLRMQHSFAPYTRITAYTDTKRSFLCPGIQNSSKPGKVLYMSPELWSGTAWDAYAADCWSLGAILYMMLVGQPAYNIPDRRDSFYDDLIDGTWSRRLQDPTFDKIKCGYAHLSPSVISLLNKIFDYQDTRSTCEEILAHPWFNEV